MGSRTADDCLTDVTLAARFEKVCLKEDPIGSTPHGQYDRKRTSGEQVMAVPQAPRPGTAQPKRPSGKRPSKKPPRAVFTKLPAHRSSSVLLPSNDAFGPAFRINKMQLSKTLSFSQPTRDNQSLKPRPSTAVPAARQQPAGASAGSSLPNRVPMNPAGIRGSQELRFSGQSVARSVGHIGENKRHEGKGDEARRDEGRMQRSAQVEAEQVEGSSSGHDCGSDDVEPLTEADSADQSNKSSHAGATVELDGYNEDKEACSLRELTSPLRMSSEPDPSSLSPPVYDGLSCFGISGVVGVHNGQQNSATDFFYNELMAAASAETQQSQQQDVARPRLSQLLPTDQQVRRSSLQSSPQLSPQAPRTKHTNSPRRHSIDVIFTNGAEQPPETSAQKCGAEQGPETSAQEKEVHLDLNALSELTEGSPSPIDQIDGAWAAILQDNPDFSPWEPSPPSSPPVAQLTRLGKRRQALRSTKKTLLCSEALCHGFDITTCDAELSHSNDDQECVLYELCGPDDGDDEHSSDGDSVPVRPSEKDASEAGRCFSEPDTSSPIHHIFCDGDIIQVRCFEVEEALETRQEQEWLSLSDGRGWVLRSGDSEGGFWKKVSSEWPHYRLKCRGKSRCWHLRDEPDERSASLHQFCHLDIIEVSCAEDNWLALADGSGWVLAGDHSATGKGWELLEKDEWEFVPDSPYFDKIKKNFIWR